MTERDLSWLIAGLEAAAFEDGAFRFSPPYQAKLADAAHQQREAARCAVERAITALIDRVRELEANQARAQDAMHDNNELYENKIAALEADLEKAKQWEPEPGAYVRALQTLQETEAELEESIAHGNKMSDFSNIWEEKCADLEANLKAANNCCDALEVMHYQALEQVKALEAELVDWKGRAERQYDFNVEQIAREAALEADKARLDWLLSTCITDLPGKVEAWDTFYHLTREMIDAAMTAENGPEGQP